MTALIIAAGKGHTDAAAALISAGADINAKNNKRYAHLPSRIHGESLFLRSHKFVCTCRLSAEDYARENGKAVEYAEAVRKVQRVWRSTLGLGHEQSGRDRMTWIDLLLRLLSSAAVRGWGSEPA